MQSLFHNIKNWCDFKSKLSNLDAKSRGDAFESLVRFYLQIAPHYKTILKNVWRSTEIPDKLFSHLNLPPSDKGIDLIAETHRGEYWAIQCKYREDESSSLTWKEVSTFSGLAFGHCRNITFGLLCTTTEHVTSILKKHHSVGLCCIDVWMDLDEHFYNQINSLLETRSLRFASPLQPLPHQERAIESAFEHFITNGESRGKLIMPCGTGKSLTAHWIAEKIEAKDILIAVPSLALIRQTFKVWLGQLIARERDVDWICVCSDESAGKVERDDLTLLKQDLGIPCMTDPQEIAGWLKTRRGEMNIVFTTYHSGKSIAQAAREQSIEFDLAILDEAHKTVGSKSKLFSHLLYDKNIRIRNRLFMTATERRYAGESEHIASMDDPVLYGDTFALLSFKEALESNPPVLSDYRVITISVRKSEVTELIEKNLMIHLEKEDWDREVEARILASMIALRKAMQNFPIRHAVSFHNSIKRARIFKDCQDKFSALFPKYGKLDTYHVSGKT